MRRVQFDGVIVSHWRTQKHKVLEYEDSTDLRTFVDQAKIAFVEDLEDPGRGCSLFFVSNSEDAVSDRTRIVASNFRACMKLYFDANPLNCMPTIYFHDDLKSPQGSPILLVRQRSDSSSDRSSSRRSGQTDFSDCLHRRDAAKCVFCDSTENLMGAHVVEIKESDIIDSSLFGTLGLSGLMDTTNGMTLCKPCHDQYDAYYVCLDPTSTIVVSNALLNSPDRGLREKWLHLNNKVISAPTTAGHWVTNAALQHRYLENERRRSKAAELKWVCDICQLGFAKEKGLNAHKRIGTRCARLQLATKAKIRSQQTPMK